MAWKSIINDHEQINTIYQVWGVLTGNLLSKLSILPPFTSRTGNPCQGFPGMLIDFTITNTTTIITSTIMSLTGHLMDKANIVSHGADHVDQGVLLHLDRRVRDEDEGVEGGSISWQHVVDLWVHS